MSGPHAQFRQRTGLGKGHSSGDDDLEVGWTERLHCIDLVSKAIDDVGTEVQTIEKCNREQ